MLKELKMFSSKQIVEISKELLERVLTYLERYDDQSDYRGDSWKSKQLEKDINDIADVLGLPQKRI